MIILALFISVLPVLEGFFNKTWDHDVYTGRQFNDLLTDTKTESPEIITRALLVLYAPSCESRLNMKNLGLDRLPLPQYMVFVKHDYESSARCVWYQMDFKDRLKDRYHLEQCLEFLYFDKGKSLFDQPEKYSKPLGYGVFYWIWYKLSIQLTIINNRNHRVMVEFHGDGPKMSEFTIETNSTVTVDCYVSYIITIFCAETRTFIYGAVLSFDDDKAIIQLEPTALMESPVDAWYNLEKIKQLDIGKDIAEWRRTIAMIYIHDFKQPVLLPKFTELGYKKGTIPLDLYETLVAFYYKNIHKRVPEAHKVEPVINDSEVKCSMVFLSEEMVRKTAEVMKPLIEEWSNVSLEMTSLYGIREYYTGNILRNHVDKVRTHVLSVILQIDKDLGGQPDWELEIIGFDGLRKNVTLQPGEYLFYESAALVHGRPFPYKGNIFANIFLHYRPQHGWKWTKDNHGQWFLLEGQEVEPIEILGTESMCDVNINLKRFVKVTPHSHDEL